MSGEREEKVCPTYARTHGHLGESKVVRESKKMSEGEIAREQEKRKRGGEGAKGASKREEISRVVEENFVSEREEGRGKRISPPHTHMHTHKETR